MNFNGGSNVVLIVLSLLLGAAGISTLNNANNLSQLQQQLGVLAGPFLLSATTLATAQDENRQVEGEQAESGQADEDQSDAGQTIPPAAEDPANPLLPISDLLVFDTHPILLNAGVPAVSMTVAYTVEQPVATEFRMTVAQDANGDALQTAYQSGTASVALTGTQSNALVELPFTILPPTGRYVAQVTARSDDWLVSQPVVLVVANGPEMTLQHHAGNGSGNREIVIAGGRWCTSWFAWLIRCVKSFQWNPNDLVLWEKYLRPYDYYLVASELVDHENGNIGHLALNDKLGVQRVWLQEGKSTAIRLEPQNIEFPGAYTGTLSIIDSKGYTTEDIPVLVRARDYSLLPFGVILIFYLVLALVMNFVPDGSGVKRVHWGRAAFSFLWAFVVAVAGMIYIEDRLSTFGSSGDYYAAMGWLLGVTVVAATAPVVFSTMMNRIFPPQRDSTPGSTTVVPPAAASSSGRPLSTAWFLVASVSTAGGLITALLALSFSLLLPTSLPILWIPALLSMGVGPVLGSLLATSRIRSNWKELIGGFVGSLIPIIGLLVVWPIAVKWCNRKYSFERLLLGSLLGMILGAIVAIGIGLLMGENPYLWVGPAWVMGAAMWGGAAAASMRENQ